MRTDVAGRYGGRTMDTISFYFSNFPDSHDAKEMLRAFALYGKAMEVVIPPKRNKWGKRFGFVRFAEVDEPRIFAVKLDNIIFGADKIHVNLPRFERERHEKWKNTATTATIRGNRRVWKKKQEAKEGREDEKAKEKIETMGRMKEEGHVDNRRGEASKHGASKLQNDRGEGKSLTVKKIKMKDGLTGKNTWSRKWCTTVRKTFATYGIMLWRRN